MWAVIWSSSHFFALPANFQTIAFNDTEDLESGKQASDAASIDTLPDKPQHIDGVEHEWSRSSVAAASTTVPGSVTGATQADEEAERSRTAYASGVRDLHNTLATLDALEVQAVVRDSKWTDDDAELDIQYRLVKESPQTTGTNTLSNALQRVDGSEKIGTNVVWIIQFTEATVLDSSSSSKSHDRFMLTKAPPRSKSEKPTWARVGSRAMPFDSLQLQEQALTHYRRTGEGHIELYADLSAHQQGAMDRVMEIQNSKTAPATCSLQQRLSVSHSYL